MQTGEDGNELSNVVKLLRDISGHTDPQEMLAAYARHRGALFEIDRSVSLSRRDLVPPFYRITRSDLWAEPINPWTQRDLLPLLDRGLLGELLYAGEPRIINELNVHKDDPAAEYFDGMASLAAIPHFDNGLAVNMVVHMRWQAHGFDVKQFPDLVLLSGVFGRAMKALVTATELEHARRQLQDQFLATAELSDTILEQAQELKKYSNSLEGRVRERTEELESAHLEAIYMLAAASETKDENTGDHIRRIEQSSAHIARAMGLRESQVRDIAQGAVLHDVGKLHVPDHILKKPGPLTDVERLIMQDHTLAGERILPDRPFYWTARRIARSHHENWDGSGYPDGLRGDAIPLEARIVHLADVHDALTNVRPYKLAWPFKQAMDFLSSQRGAMFDPQIVDMFMENQCGSLGARATPAATSSHHLTVGDIG